MNFWRPWVSKTTPSAWNDPWCWRRVAPASNNVSTRACFDPITNILYADVEQTHWPQIHTTLIRSVLFGAPSYWFFFTWKGFEACINLHSTLNPKMYKQNNYIWTMVCVLHLISAKLEQLRTFCNNVWNNTYLQRVQGLIWAIVYFMTCVCILQHVVIVDACIDVSNKFMLVLTWNDMQSPFFTCTCTFWEKSKTRYIQNKKKQDFQ